VPRDSTMTKIAQELSALSSILAFYVRVFFFAFEDVAAIRIGFAE